MTPFVATQGLTLSNGCKAQLFYVLSMTRSVKTVVF